MEIEVEKRTHFKIYWAGEHDGFSEKKCSDILIYPNKKKYHFYLTNLSTAKKLRIDPHQYKGKSTIASITFQQRGLKEISLASNEAFTSLSPINQIANYSIAHNKIEIVSTGKDPSLQYIPRTEKVAFGWPAELLRLAILFSVTFFGGLLAAPLLSNYRFVPLLLTVAVVLAAVIAGLTVPGSHPDEIVHLKATQYYQDHWLPPKVDDEQIRDTYSRYGFSRLNNHEIYYLFAGKFTTLLSPLHIKDYITVRFLNVLLLTTILLISIRFSSARLVAIPLLLSPQIWYVFSYCNSDAFALFMVFLAGWQVIGTNTAFKNFISGVSKPKGLFYTLFFGIFLGLLLLLKKDFYFFLLFLAGYMLLSCWQKRKEVPLKRGLTRLVAVCLVGCCIFALRLGADYQVNGLDRDEKIAAMRIATTEPLFNPTTPLNKQFAYLRMKDRGVSYKTILHKHRWAEKSFRSAFGVYGYTSVAASFVFYDLIRISLLGLLLSFSMSLLLQGDWNIRLLYLWTIFLATALIGASFYHAWSADFQAQGRYLFPIFSMLGVTAAAARHILPKRILASLVLLLFTQSCYSFIFVGLQGLPK